MSDVAREAKRRLERLVGLKLSVARRAADMRVFHFGEVRAVAHGTVGEYALHIQCPWRVEGPDGIVTGWCDIAEPIGTGSNVEGWDYDKDGNLQDARLLELFGAFDQGTGSALNKYDRLVVEWVRTDDAGGAVLELSGGFRLSLFPSGSRAEDWRLFRHDGPHFVVAGGKIKE